MIDQSLPGETMATNVISKASDKLKLLYRYKLCLNMDLWKRLCQALLQCHIDYCCSYLISYAVRKSKLQVIQNKIVCFILNLSSRSHICQAQLDALNYLSIKDRASQLGLNHVFKVVYETSPVHLYETMSVVYLVDIHVQEQVAAICIYQVLKA